MQVKAAHEPCRHRRINVPVTGDDARNPGGEERVYKVFSIKWPVVFSNTRGTSRQHRQFRVGQEILRKVLRAERLLGIECQNGAAAIWSPVTHKNENLACR